MNNEFTYREATEQDIPQLIRLGLVSYGQYEPLLTEENRQKMRATIADAANWKSILSMSKSFLCMDGDTLAGMAFLVRSGNPWDIFQADWSYIRMVGVDPAYEGKGIAKTLTRMCIEYAKQTGEKTIALHTSEIMPAARHIYESFGFKILREIPLRLGVRYWIYTLELD
jgi:ribosomal protein S18 acetylase RimI-like enzyme